jgi:hypothetical protein
MTADIEFPVGWSARNGARRWRNFHARADGVE